MTEISNNKIFITGGTGYIGRRLIPELIKRNLEVHSLTRESSVNKLPPGCILVTGNALDRFTFVDKIAPCKTFIQLIGVPHPSPSKKLILFPFNNQCWRLKMPALIISFTLVLRKEPML